MSFIAPDPTSSYLLGGERISGNEIRQQNGNQLSHILFYMYLCVIITVRASLAIANVVKSSLGPVGMFEIILLYI